MRSEVINGWGMMLWMDEEWRNEWIRNEVMNG